MASAGYPFLHVTYCVHLPPPHSIRSELPFADSLFRAKLELETKRKPVVVAVVVEICGRGRVAGAARDMVAVAPLPLSVLCSISSVLASFCALSLFQPHFTSATTVGQRYSHILTLCVLWVCRVFVSVC